MSKVTRLLNCGDWIVVFGPCKFSTKSYHLPEEISELRLVRTKSQRITRTGREERFCFFDVFLLSVYTVPRGLEELGSQRQVRHSFCCHKSFVVLMLHIKAAQFIYTCFKGQSEKT